MTIPAIYFRKIQAIVNCDEAERIARGEVPSVFLHVCRTDRAERPQRSDSFNIMLSIEETQQGFSIDVQKNSYRRLRNESNLSLLQAEKAVREIVRHRVDTLAQLYMEHYPNTLSQYSLNDPMWTAVDRATGRAGL